MTDRDYMSMLMMDDSLHEPDPRYGPYSAVINEELCLWGGKLEATTSLQVYHPCLESWRELHTHGPPPPGLYFGASAPSEQYLYAYGGYKAGSSYTGCLHKLDTKTSSWTQLAAHSADAPMKKVGCGMIVYENSVIVIGGHGMRNGPIQPGSEWRKLRDEDDEEDPNITGWTNEMHKYDLSEGSWSSITCTGTRPPPCSSFSLTMVDSHRAVLFGGIQAGHCYSDGYILDLTTMHWSKIPCNDGGPLIPARNAHAAVCLDYGGDRPQLVVTGGCGVDGNVFNDVWIMDVQSGRWKEIPVPNLQSSYRHCAAAFSLSPGVSEVVMFGGTSRYQAPRRSDFIADTTVLRFGKDLNDPQAEWVLTDVADKTQRGTSERIREKMTKLSQLTHKISSSKEKPVDLAYRAERLREAQRSRHEAKRSRREAEKSRREADMSRQEADRRSREVANTRRDAENASQKAERNNQEAIESKKETERSREVLEKRAQEAERGKKNADKRAQEAERGREEAEKIREEAESSMKEAESSREEADKKREESDRRREEAERSREEAERSREEAENMREDAEKRSEESEKRSDEAERNMLEAERCRNEADRRSAEAEQNREIAERRREEADRGKEEADRRVQEAEIRCQDLDRRLEEKEQQEVTVEGERNWLVQRREIHMTSQILGGGGWGEVKIANFRGIEVAAKVLYKQLQYPYYHSVFIREMNMASRVRHPNLVQFIGASMDEEMVILMERMPTSLREHLASTSPAIPSIAFRISVSLDVAKALNYLHLMQPHPIIHRDISSANVLLELLPNQMWRAKVTDCGSVNLQNQLKTENPGSPAYSAPEACIPSQQSTKMDTFSFGVLLIEMCTTQFPDEDKRLSIMHSIKERQWVVIIQQCIHNVQTQRPAMSQIISQLISWQKN